MTIFGVNELIGLCDEASDSFLRILCCELRLNKQHIIKLRVTT